MYYTNISGEKQLINTGLDTAKNHETEAFYENRTEKEREVHTHLFQRKTVRNYHLLLSSIFTTAVQWQVIFSNPCMRVKPPKVHHKEERYLDEKEAAELIRQLVQGLRL